MIDGEHYAPVVRDALAELPYDVVAALLVGRRREAARRRGLRRAARRRRSRRGRRVRAGARRRPLRRAGARAARAAAAREPRRSRSGCRTSAPDFRFDPPALEPFALPSLAVIGTGKRVGKTAVTGHLARLLARDRDVVVVAMGRGGPPEPEVVEAPPTLDDLLALSRAGRHAASDHLETAALAGVPTIGCRRCGGGLAGAPLRRRTCSRARALAAELEPDARRLRRQRRGDPAGRGRRARSSSRARRTDVATGPQRVPRPRLRPRVVDDGATRRRSRRDPRSSKDVPVVAVELRLRPVEPLARPARRGLHDRPPAPTLERICDGAEVVLVSRNLADRDALREDLERVDAEVYLVEMKAAAIDVVAEARARARAPRSSSPTNDVVAGRRARPRRGAARARRPAMRRGGAA